MLPRCLVWSPCFCVESPLRCCFFWSPHGRTASIGGQLWPPVLVVGADLTPTKKTRCHPGKPHYGMGLCAACYRAATSDPRIAAYRDFALTVLDKLRDVTWTPSHLVRSVERPAPAAGLVYRREVHTLSTVCVDCGSRHPDHSDECELDTLLSIDIDSVLETGR